MSRGAGDRVLVGGTILTMDGSRRRVEAVWLHENRVAEVGSRADVIRAAPTTAEVVDLQGAAVVPGFIDAHCHIGAMAYLAGTLDCSPRTAPNLAGLLDHLADAARRATPDRWVAGHSFAENGVTERRFPTRAELDTAVPDRPCVVFHRSLHACLLNSRGLAAAGLDLPGDPPFGKLGRDADGRPDGTVYEAPMFALLARLAGEFLAAASMGERVRLVAEAASGFSAEGVTTAMDADLPGIGWLRAMIDCDAAGRLPLRLIAMVNERDAGWPLDAGLFGSSSLDRFRLGAVKVFSDGGMSSRTAAVNRPYDLPPYGRGVLFHPTGELVDIIRRSDAAGTQVAIHAQGDRAIDAVLTAFEQVIGAGSGNPLSHRIEHGGMLLAPLLTRAAAIGLHLVSQPGFMEPLGDGWLAAFGEQAKEFYPFRSAREAGLRVGGSSDAPVIDPSVRRALRDAILRQSAAGVVVGERERLTAEEALELYTRDGAYVCRADDVVGSLEPGKYADFVVLGADPTAVDPASLPDLPILQTVVGGRPTFGSGPIPD